MSHDSQREEEATPGAGGQVIALSRQQCLVIQRSTGDGSPSLPARQEEHVHFLRADGSRYLTIRITADATVVELAAGPVALKVDGDMAIEASRLSLHARDGLSLSSGTDMRIEAREALVSEARRQEIAATRGDIRVTANDDVRLNGERIQLNC